MSQGENSLVRFRLDETDDAGKQQKVKGSGRRRERLGGRQARMVVLQQFGMSTHAPKGAIGWAVMLNGNPDQMMVIGFEHPDHRPLNLAEGETMVHGAAGNSVLFKANGDVVITGNTIILEGTVKLGGADADKPAAMEGTLDSAGHSDVGNLATKVFVK